MTPTSQLLGCPTAMPNPKTSDPSQWRSHLLVAGQVLAMALICYPLRAPVGWWPALALCVLGALIAVYTLLHNKIGNFGIYPKPMRDANLVMSGPYRYVRHPMYSALLCLMLGIAGYNGGWSNWLGFGVLCVVLLGKSSLEEQYLRQRFSTYADYAGKRARFIPGVF